MSTPEGALAESSADVTPGQLQWLTEDAEGRAMVDRALDDVFGPDEDPSEDA